MCVVTISGRNQLPLWFWDLTKDIKFGGKYLYPHPKLSSPLEKHSIFIVRKLLDKASLEANYSVSVCWRLLSPIMKRGVQSVPGAQHLLGPL